MTAGLLEAESTDIESSNRTKSQLLAGKYLTFRLGKEQFGLEILKVREIMGLINITPVPKSPPFVRGVLNLRGKIIPVIDLRRKFEMSEIEVTDRTCIIVVDVTINGISADVGILVDTVSEVLSIKAEDIGPPPSLGSEGDTDFILGMAKSAGSVTVLLEIEKILGNAEVSTAMSIENEEQNN